MNVESACGNIADENPSPLLIGTGVPGLDEVLGGGFPKARVLLIEGEPGTGKTTLALQFLSDGARHSEKVLYITMSETIGEMRAVAASHGFPVDDIEFFEMFPAEKVEAEISLFHPGEIDISESAARIIAEIERVKPHRLVLDSLSELRLLFADSFHYGRYLASVKRYLTRAGISAMLLEPRSPRAYEPSLRTAVHGVVVLEQITRDYGQERRRLRVAKLRNGGFLGGFHDFAIRKGGLTVFARPIPNLNAPPVQQRHSGPACSSVPELDWLLGGGLARGSSALLVGPPGTGKSVIAVSFAAAAALRGERTVVFVFDELVQTLIGRSAALGIPVEAAIATGHLILRQLDPAALSPGEFAFAVLEAVNSDQAKMIVIDSLSGYMLTMQEERSLYLQIHEMLLWLGQKHIVTIMVLTQANGYGVSDQAPTVSSVCDAVLLFGTFEGGGSLRKSIAILKKRYGEYENSVRELELRPGSVGIGPRLDCLQGFVASMPHLVERTTAGS